MKKFISILSVLFCAVSFAGDNTEISISDYERSVEQFLLQRYQQVIDEAEQGGNVFYVTSEGVVPYKEHKLTSQVREAKKQLKSLEKQRIEAQKTLDSAQAQLAEIREAKRLKEEARNQLENKSAQLIQKTWKNHQEYKQAKAELDVLRAAHLQEIERLKRLEQEAAQAAEKARIELEQKLQAQAKIDAVKAKKTAKKERAKQRKKAAQAKDAEEDAYLESLRKVAEKEESDALGFNILADDENEEDIFGGGFSQYSNIGNGFKRLAEEQKEREKELAVKQRLADIAATDHSLAVNNLQEQKQAVVNLKSQISYFEQQLADKLFDGNLQLAKLNTKISNSLSTIMACINTRNVDVQKVTRAIETIECTVNLLGSGHISYDFDTFVESFQNKIATIMNAQPNAMFAAAGVNEDTLLQLELVLMNLTILREQDLA